MSVEGQVEWADDQVRLVRAEEVLRHPNFPRGHETVHGAYATVSRTPLAVLCHHSAGRPREGLDAVDALAKFSIADPKYKVGENGAVVLNKRGKPLWVGGGKGFPGLPYTFVVPGIPTVRDGRVTVYRVWDDQWWTWHTSRAVNKIGVSVCVSGWYASRHDALAPNARERPDPLVMLSLERLVLKYLLPRYGLTPDDLYGHFDFGKPACPGDFIEDWIRRSRGEPGILAPSGDGKVDQRELRTVRQIQEALVVLGFDPGPVDGIWGPLTANGLRAFQSSATITADGVWGPNSERALRSALALA